ncbi:MAG: hypothetical protein ACLQU3_14350 [Limisphaerales bacterium]
MAADASCRAALGVIVIIPALGSFARTARLTAALAAARSPAAAPSTGNDYQLIVMAGGAAPLVLLVALEGRRRGASTALSRGCADQHAGRLPRPPR